MRMRWRLAVLGAVLAVAAAALVPVWLGASAPPPPASQSTELPPQLEGVQWDQCMIENLVPEAVSGFFVDRDSGRVTVHVQGSDGRFWTDDDVVANPEVRSFAVKLAECLGRYPMGSETGPPQLDLAERAIYYDYLAGVLVPCLDRHGVATSVPVRPSVRYLDLTTWYVQALRVADVDLDQAIRTWRECPIVPSYLEGS